MSHLCQIMTAPLGPTTIFDLPELPELPVLPCPNSVPHAALPARLHVLCPARRAARLLPSARSAPCPARALPCPALQPARRPSLQPARRPALQLARRPALQPTLRPALQPARRPALQLARRPALQTTRRPALQLARCPALQPACRPALQPARHPACELPEVPARCSSCPRSALATTLPVMATPPLLEFDTDGLPYRFDFWLMCLRLHLRFYIRDGFSLLGHTSGSLPAPTTPTEPAADAHKDVQRRYQADSLAYRQWTERDAVAQRAVRSLLPVNQRDHFRQVTSAQAVKRMNENE
ncbi:unnamed protein product [Closterium sp. NIES-53]